MIVILRGKELTVNVKYREVQKVTDSESCGVKDYYHARGEFLNEDFVPGTRLASVLTRIKRDLLGE